MSRREFNREELDLWLGAYAGGYHAFGEKVRSPNKKRSVLPLNLIWMEANDDPEIRETNELLKRIVLHQMPAEKPRTFRLFEHVYLAEHSNPAEPENWKAGAIEAARGKASRATGYGLRHLRRLIPPPTTSPASPEPR